MKIKQESIEKLIHQIQGITEQLIDEEQLHSQNFKSIHPAFLMSAKNLIHYRKLRSFDITGIQKKLGEIGLSRLARAESHVFASLSKSLFMLRKLNNNPSEVKNKYTSFKISQKKVKTHTKDLLGYRSKGRRVRIMVTLPTEAAYNYDLVHKLMENGMNTARINCAHDEPKTWLKMISHIAEAKKKLKKNCKIAMDLAGPKIRTGAILPGPEVKKFKPKRNASGDVLAPVIYELVKELHGDTTRQLPIDDILFEKVVKGDLIQFRELRGKKRNLIVKEVGNDRILATSAKTSYIPSFTKLSVVATAYEGNVKRLPALEQSILLRTGDHIDVIKETLPGRSAELDEQGKVIKNAYISCTSAAVFDHVKAGERILFDDGKIEGVIQSIHEEGISVEILQARENGSRLKADKGINFPDSGLGISGLTSKDKEDLKFVAKHADVVNFSFVNLPGDVAELHEELRKLGVFDKLGIILKIETQKAYNNLTEILLEGMKSYPLGVMIARGDLAVEVGWKNMARIQQEIMSLCNAAHVPDVWATQVFENLAKTGVPSRSEITDAATALSAECVMLNKGPYIQKAVKLLDHILKSLNGYRDKNVKMLPPLALASGQELS